MVTLDLLFPRRRLDYFLPFSKFSMIYYFVVLKHHYKDIFIEEFYQSFIFRKKRVLIKEDERINGF